MASIRKRNSLWQAQVRSRSLGSVSKSFHKKADAVAWAKIQEAAMQTGEWKPKDKRYSTIDDLMKTYLEKTTPRKKGAETETRRLKRLLKEQALMSIKLDDQELIRTSPSSRRGKGRDFDGFFLANKGGNYALSSIKILGE